MDLKKTRSNTLGRLSTSKGGQGRATQSTPKSSEGDQANTNATNANVEPATSEDENGEIQSTWYNNEKEKRTSKGKLMRKRLRRSPRFAKEEHERLDRNEDVTTIIRGVEKDREEDEVQPVYGLGVQKNPFQRKPTSS